MAQYRYTVTEAFDPVSGRWIPADPETAKKFAVAYTAVSDEPETTTSTAPTSKSALFASLGIESAPKAQTPARVDPTPHPPIVPIRQDNLAGSPIKDETIEAICESAGRDLTLDEIIEIVIKATKPKKKYNIKPRKDPNAPTMVTGLQIREAIEMIDQMKPDDQQHPLVKENIGGLKAWLHAFRGEHARPDEEQVEVPKQAMLPKGITLLVKGPKRAFIPRLAPFVLPKEKQ